MSYSCKILLDSISETRKRLTTFEITFPRIVLAEFNTHRMFSRNSASSRAIPFIRQLERVDNNPFIPERFPINDKGMQPNKYYEQGSIEYQQCEFLWLSARDKVVNHATQLVMEDSEIGAGLKVHKQIANRLLEPFMWHTVIVTATEFDNFFKLRCDENAQYEIRRIADLMYEAYHAYDDQWINPSDAVVKFNAPDKSWIAIKPQKLKVGEWHCPLVYEEDRGLIYEYWGRKDPRKYSILSEEHRYEYATHLLKQISVARCARVSYLTHDGKRDIEKDLELFERLRTSGHYSPFEHVAQPSFTEIDSEMDAQFEHEIYSYIGDRTFHEHRNGNFIGWRQMRQDLPNENCTYFRKENSNERSK